MFVVTLYYGTYGIAADGFYRLLKSLKNKNVPVHGCGVRLLFWLWKTDVITSDDHERDDTYDTLKQYTIMPLTRNMPPEIIDRFLFFLFCSFLLNYIPFLLKDPSTF